MTAPEPVLPDDFAEAEAGPMALGNRLTQMANELLEPMLCKTPAYGYPGAPGGHCAACCYGTGVVITCDEDRLIYEAAEALSKAAAACYSHGLEDLT